MDFGALFNTIMSGDTIKNMSQLTGTSDSAVESVLSSALPSLISGAQSQAENKDTAEGFANALKDHAKDDTSDLSSFLSNVDLADGSKIIGHLLGGGQEEATKTAADKAGLDFGQAGNILSAAAPLLMSLLGQQSEQEPEKEEKGGLAGLFGNLDIGSLLGGLFGKK